MARAERLAAGPKRTPGGYFPLTRRGGELQEPSPCMNTPTPLSIFLGIPIPEPLSKFFGPIARRLRDGNSLTLSTGASPPGTSSLILLGFLSLGLSRPLMIGRPPIAVPYLVTQDYLGGPTVFSDGIVIGH
jgi:hypothetical protein